MKIISDENLKDLYGGSSNSISGTIINAFTNIIKLLADAGRGLGSSLRRIGEGNLCPLEWFLIVLFLSFCW